MNERRPIYYEVSGFSNPNEVKYAILSHDMRPWNLTCVSPCCAFLEPQAKALWQLTNTHYKFRLLCAEEAAILKLQGKLCS